jgi:hypothetical protein
MNQVVQNHYSLLNVVKQIMQGKPSGNYVHRLLHPSVSMHFVFMARMILGVNSDHFLKQR